MTYPLAMRKHILDTKEREKLTFQATADRFNIGIATLMRWGHTLEPQLTRTKQPPAKAGGLAITTKVGIRVKDPFKSLF